jgi:hypothetical protein
VNEEIPIRRRVRRRRLVDEVVRLKDCGAKQLVYSPKLMANIFLPRKELNEVEE